MADDHQQRWSLHPHLPSPNLTLTDRIAPDGPTRPTAPVPNMPRSAECRCPDVGTPDGYRVVGEGSQAMEVQDILSAILMGAVIGTLGRLALPGRQDIGVFVTL